MTKASADFYDAYAAEINNTSGVWQTPPTLFGYPVSLVLKVEGEEIDVSHALRWNHVNGVTLHDPDVLQAIRRIKGSQGDNDHKTEIPS